MEQQLIVDATHGWATELSRHANACSRIFVEHARQQSILSKLALEEDMPVVVFAAEAQAGVAFSTQERTLQ